MLITTYKTAEQKYLFETTQTKKVLLLKKPLTKLRT